MNADTNIEKMNLEEIMAVLDEEISAWGLPTRAARRERRLLSSLAEVESFYNSMLPYMPRIIEQLNEFPLDAMPVQYKGLIYTTFAVIEADFPVNKYKAIVPNQVSDPRATIGKSNYRDYMQPYDSAQATQDQINYRDQSDAITLI